jgi:hypothetical protein
MGVRTCEALLSDSRPRPRRFRVGGVARRRLARQAFLHITRMLYTGRCRPAYLPGTLQILTNWDSPRAAQQRMSMDMYTVTVYMLQVSKFGYYCKKIP